MKVETETEMEMEADIKKTQSEEMMNRLGPRGDVTDDLDKYLLSTPHLSPNDPG